MASWRWVKHFWKHHWKCLMETYGGCVKMHKSTTNKHIWTPLLQKFIYYFQTQKKQKLLYQLGMHVWWFSKHDCSFSILEKLSSTFWKLHMFWTISLFITIFFCVLVNNEWIALEHDAFSLFTIDWTENGIL